MVAILASQVSYRQYTPPHQARSSRDPIRGAFNSGFKPSPSDLQASALSHDPAEIQTLIDLNDADFHVVAELFRQDPQLAQQFLRSFPAAPDRVAQLGKRLLLDSMQTKKTQGLPGHLSLNSTFEISCLQAFASLPIDGRWNAQLQALVDTYQVRVNGNLIYFSDAKALLDHRVPTDADSRITMGLDQVRRAAPVEMPTERDALVGHLNTYRAELGLPAIAFAELGLDQLRDLSQRMDALHAELEPEQRHLESDLKRYGPYGNESRVQNFATRMATFRYALMTDSEVVEAWDSLRSAQFHVPQRSLSAQDARQHLINMETVLAQQTVLQAKCADAANRKDDALVLIYRSQLAELDNDLQGTLLNTAERDLLVERERAAAKDDAFLGVAYQRLTGVPLSEAQNTAWGTIGANSLVAGQDFATMFAHPWDTAKGFVDLFTDPDTGVAALDALCRSWEHATTAGRVGLAWQAAFSIVVGDKVQGAAMGAAWKGVLASARTAGRLAEVGRVFLESAAPVGTAIREGLGRGRVVWQEGMQGASAAGQMVWDGMGKLGDRAMAHADAAITAALPDPQPIAVGPGGMRTVMADVPETAGAARPVPRDPAAVRRLYPPDPPPTPTVVGSAHGGFKFVINDIRKAIDQCPLFKSDPKLVSRYNSQIGRYLSPMPESEAALVDRMVKAGVPVEHAEALARIAYDHYTFENVATGAGDLRPSKTDLSPDPERISTPYANDTYRLGNESYEVMYVDPQELSFSQKTVGFNVNEWVSRFKSNLGKTAADYWDFSRRPIIAVRTKSGEIISLDNRRVLAARLAGKSEIPTIIVDEGTLVQGRLAEVYHIGGNITGKTWGDVLGDLRSDMRRTQKPGGSDLRGYRENPRVSPPKIEVPMSERLQQFIREHHDKYTYANGQLEMRAGSQMTKEELAALQKCFSDTPGGKRETMLSAINDLYKQTNQHYE